MRLFSAIKSRLPWRRVLVHTATGDIVLRVHPGNIIRVPWLFSWHTCPFHLEPDGSVTLRLVWPEGRAKGYGKVWESITWEPVK